MRALALPLLVGLVALGCASSPEEGEAPHEGSSAPYRGSIGTVSVMIDAAAEASDREMLTRYEVPEQVRSEVTTKLRAAGRQSDAAAASLDIKITRFRLRGGAMAFWLGAMAGSDFITVEATVNDGGAPVKTYQTSTSTILGGIAFVSPTKRKNRLANTLSTRIVDGL